MGIDVEALLALKPSDVLEFRPRVHSADVLADLIASFAHASGGTIVVGYNRRRRRGVRFKKEHLIRLVEQAEEILGGQKDLSTLEFVKAGRKELGVLRVPRVDYLVVSRHGLLVRDHDAARPMTRVEILQRLTGTKELGKDEIAAMIEKLTVELNRGKSVWEKLLDHSLSYAVSSVTALLGALVGWWLAR